MKLHPMASLAIIFAALPAQALTVDYAYVSSHTFNQQVYNAVGQQTWMFTHASVGGNMIGGMNTLHSTTPSQYQLTTRSASASSPPAVTTPGSVYDINRGNPGWKEKVDFFAAAMQSGWGNKVDFVMDKLCYIDEAANVNYYLNMMETLDSQYSATFVYTTMPLTTSTGSDNVLRNNYNNEVRAYASAHNKLLFDIADLEAHNGAQEITFTNSGSTYQRLYPGWSDDGGHLNPVGREMMAKAWYAVAASQATGSQPVPEPSTMALMGIGLIALVKRRFSARKNSVS